jgi:hypothetical protein
MEELKRRFNTCHMSFLPSEETEGLFGIEKSKHNIRK